MRASLREAQSVEFRVKRDGCRQLPAPHPISSGSKCAAGRSTGRAGDDAAEREVVAVIRDVTERKSQEQALEDARAESERANAAKTRFLATMSHELRTPLNAIIGFSEMLTNEEQMRLDAARRHEYAKLINDSGNHLLAVVNGILDMSKMETGDFEITPEPFAPGEVIGHCCDLLALKAARGRHSIWSAAVPADLPDIVADKRALKQILLNLLSNAVKFTDRGGCVTVSAETSAARISSSRWKTPASASATATCRGSAIRSSRRARPMTAATTAPDSVCRS